MQAGPAFMKPSGRMERNDVVGQMKAMGGDASLAANLGYGYGIQVDGAAAAGKNPAGAAAAAGAAGAGKLHSSSKDVRKDAARAAAAGGSHRSSSSQHKSGSGAAGAGGGGSRAGRDPPIILVPSGVTAMINIFNAKQFLEEGRFVPRWVVLLLLVTLPSCVSQRCTCIIQVNNWWHLVVVYFVVVWRDNDE
jgi:parafibromin